MIIVVWFLDVFAFFVHSLCTGRSVNEVFILLIEKKKKTNKFIKKIKKIREHKKSFMYLAYVHVVFPTLPPAFAHP